jgi:C4-dicarboxylate transporter DctM subunit
MSPLSLAIAAVLLFALLEAPLFSVIGGLAMVCLYATDMDPQSLQVVVIEMNRLASMPVLMALPPFTFVGMLLTESGAPRRIMNFMNAATGWLPGGLAIAALGACAFFTALTGASGVTIVALGSVLYPILRQQHYDERFTLGLLTAGGSLGLLFPPSLPIILYGVVAQVDIGQVFKAALVPGILLVVLLSAYAGVRQWHRMRTGANGNAPLPDGVSPPPAKKPAGELKRAFWEGKWDWPIIVIILVGVYGGFVTIAEVSALVVFYVLVVECFILKEISVTRQLPKIIVESTILSGAIIIILAMSLALTGYLVDAQVPDRIMEALTALTDNRYTFLAGLNLFLLAVGCMMDIFSAVVIVVPIMVPVAMQYGIDPIHLCIIFLVNLEIGYSTPPVGINLFIASMKFQKPVTLLYRAAIPFLILRLIFLGLITYVPFISLFWIS